MYTFKLMKKLRIQIKYCGYSADFMVTCEDTPQGIENAILDKLGKNEVLFEKNGFTVKTGKWITYEEVSNDRRPIHYEEVLGARVATGTPEGGQI